MGEALQQTLTDFDFLETKAGTLKVVRKGVKKEHNVYGGIYEIIDDFDFAFDNWLQKQSSKLSKKRENLFELRDVLLEKAQIFSFYPDLIFQCCYNHVSAGPLSVTTNNWLKMNEGHSHNWMRKMNRSSLPATGVRLLEHNSSVDGLSFTADGRFLLSIAGADPVHVWDSETGKLERTLNLFGSWAYEDRPFLGDIAATEKTLGLLGGYCLYFVDMQDWRAFEKKLCFKDRPTHLVASKKGFFVAADRFVTGTPLCQYK